MTYVGLFQAVLFFLAALVVQQASFFAFSTLCLINVISDVASDFAGGLRMPLVKEKVAESDLMEAYSFFAVYYLHLCDWRSSFWSLAIRGVNTELFARSGNQCHIFPSVSSHSLFRKG